MTSKSTSDNPMLEMLIAERNRKIITLDEEWAWEILKEQGIKHRPPRKNLLAGLHKARIDLVSTPPELREISRKWLKTRGFSHTPKILH